MKKIKLTQGKYALVDDKDYKYLNQWKWYCNAQGYAVREYKKDTSMWMHRMVNKTPKGFDTDHIDGNRLNNTRSNLRTVTHAQNLFNQKVRKDNKSGCKGVSWYKETSKWRAYITLSGKQFYLGLFESIKEAIKARQNAEEVYHAI